jgi:hypothetical protein
MTIYLSTIHRVLRLTRVVLTPKFDHCGFLRERNTYPNSSQRTIWSKEIVKLEIGMVSWEEFDETRGS